MDYSTTSQLSMAELNAAALEHFVFTPVSRQMIEYLADAAFNVIQCDPNMMPASQSQSGSHHSNAAPRSPSARAVSREDSALPSLEDFITQLMVSSNVQVPTLMSTLVYLNRLKARLQPMAKGLRCTTHRIFLASLILAAKYLNDSSPKNKHWANYSVISNDAYSFGFSRTEVNLMEKQLLLLLDWDLRITEEDLYRELDPFLAPIRADVAARHARRQQRKRREEEEREQKKRRMRAAAAAAAAAEEEQAWLAASTVRRPETAYMTPPSSRGHSRSRSRHSATPGVDETPGLSYSSSTSSSSSSSSSSSARSYASSLSSVSSARSSRATTPLDPEDLLLPQKQSTSYPYPSPSAYSQSASSSALDLDAASAYSSYYYDSPVQVVLDAPAGAGKRKEANSNNNNTARSMLPYEISAEELRELQDGGNRVKRMRGVLGRVFSSGVAVR